MMRHKTNGGATSMADGDTDQRTARITGEEALAMHASGRPGKLEPASPSR